MSKDVPTPYMWSYQPQSGHAAGAAQDYSTRINWLSAGPSMINQVNNIRRRQNEVLLRQALTFETPRLVRNPPFWPAEHLIQQAPRQLTFELPRNTALEIGLTNHGLQLAGGGVEEIPPIPINEGPTAGAGIRSFAPSERVTASHLRPDGVFQLGGGGRSSFNPVQAFLTLQSASTTPRSGGVGSRQFVQEFTPSVYINPFSGPPGTYPDEFIPNYDIVSDSVAGYD